MRVSLVWLHRCAGGIAFLTAAVFSSAVCASEHPGNVHVTGEDVRIALPAGWNEWRALDIDGNVIGLGTAKGGAAELGALPVGYYEVYNRATSERVTAAVLPKIVASPDTPIAIDAAISWFYPDDREKILGASKLCRLAGVTWVRDRLSWPELETARGTFAGETRYERAMRLQHEAGLKVLQVNHISPPWAAPDPKRFPEDLRDVYNFYRGLSERWKGLADAIEPWNEPDIEIFGGHTGCEIASFHKAAALGLKAGHQQQLVCGTVFALDRAETLDEFGPNEVYPYFDRYNLHHYIGLPAYPRAYGRHRAVSGGRPMWTTEFNLMVHWADEKTQEPSEEDLRVQGYRVSKVFSAALHEGVEKAFYFILGHYVERNLQYGLVHHDLTPRPAYVAFAAVGRLLADAKPLGRVDFGDEKLKAYAFRTRIDGEDRETIVAWSETKPTMIEVGPAERIFDYLGRKMAKTKRVQLTRAPLFLVMAPGDSKEFTIEPPPAKAKWLDGEPCPVVLQLVGKTDFAKSAFELPASNELRLIAYNFGNKPASGKFLMEGAMGTADVVELSPGERTEQTIEADGDKNVTVRLDVGDAGRAVVSANVIGSKSGE